MNRLTQVQTILSLRATIAKAYRAMHISDNGVMWECFKSIKDDINALPIMRTELARAIKTGAHYPQSVIDRMPFMPEREYIECVTHYTRAFKGLTRAQLKQKGY